MSPVVRHAVVGVWQPVCAVQITPPLAAKPLVAVVQVSLVRSPEVAQAVPDTKHPVCAVQITPLEDAAKPLAAVVQVSLLSPLARHAVPEVWQPAWGVPARKYNTAERVSGHQTGQQKDTARERAMKGTNR